MSKVQRYFSMSGIMAMGDTGSYVAIEDYEALESVLTAERARRETLETAARNRLKQGHNDTCSKALVAEHECSCGQDALEASLGAQYPRVEQAQEGKK